MPFCANCGHEVADGVAFCPQCGAAVAGTAVGARVGVRNYATFGPRFLGHLIDFVLVAVVSGIIGRIEEGIYGFSIIGNLLGIAYVWYFTSQGQTIGQQVMGLRIIDEAGNPPGPGRAIIRVLASILSTIPIFLGYFWALWQPERRTWHDILAGTWVIKE